jgi:hypothetical protein
MTIDKCSQASCNTVVVATNTPEGQKPKHFSGSITDRDTFQEFVFENKNMSGKWRVEWTRPSLGGRRHDMPWRVIMSDPG